MVEIFALISWNSGFKILNLLILKTKTPRMKKTFLSLSLLSFICCGTAGFAQSWTNNQELINNPNPNFYDMQKAFNEYYKDKIIDWQDDDSYNHFKRWEAFMEPRVFPTGKFFSPAASYNAMVERDMNASKNGGNQQVQAGNWTPLGPQSTGMPGVGRIDCIAFQPALSTTVWCGTAGGGLWKSTNSGTTWADFSGGVPNLSVADIAINPTTVTTMYIATGDGFGYIGFSNIFWGGTYSTGVLKSTNGGTTWATTGLSFTVGQRQIINRLLIHPTNPNILIAVGTNGIDRSSNGGTSWTNVSNVARFYDAEFNVTQPNTIYASCSNGVYRSTDAGVTWALLANSPTFTGRVSLETTAASATTIYCMDQTKKIGKTTDGGTTWTTPAGPGGLTLYGYYDCVLSASPVNANTVYAAGYNMYRTTDGGASWASVAAGSMHVDNHVLEFLPGSNTTIWCGNDGGIYRTTTGTSPWTNFTNGLQITQFYRFSNAATNSGIIYGGAQDNGTNRLSGGTWTSGVLGGDGMECVVDFTNSNIVYASSQNGSWAKSTNGGGSFAGIPTGGGAWTSPMVMHPTTNTTLYYGGAEVKRSTNSGTSFTNISALGIGNIISLAVAKSNPNYIYAATYGQIHMTSNGGTNWTSITGTLPVSNNAITYIAISGSNPQKVWVTMSGYVSGQKVYASIDGGTTWTNVSTNLPNIPVNCIVYDNNSANDGLYCGTDLGVYYMDNLTSGWQTYNTGLPNVIVNELEIHYGSLKLRAATYGRGVWESPLTITTGTAPKISTASTISLYPNPSSGQFYVDVVTEGTSDVLLNVYNVVGQKVLSQNDFVDKSKQISLDLSSQPKGIYMVEIRTNFETRTEKVILQN